MTKQDIISEWASALDADTFLTAKHDPSSLSISFGTFRTVLSAEASSSLERFIKSGSYSIRHYEDTGKPKSAGVFEIVPLGTAPFDVAGSGVAPGSLTPSGSYDRLLVVSGALQGWHVYAEDSSRLSGSGSIGRWKYSGEY